MVNELDDIRSEMSEISASLRELLEYEAQLCGGVPLIDIGTVSALGATKAGAMPTEASSAALDTLNPPQPLSTPSLSAAPSPDDVKTRLRILAEAAASCTSCRLQEGRTKSVFARGSTTASVMFVGEGPGYNEDQQGKPFVGQAGQLLDKMIAAMGLDEGEFYICNVVKCRPPNNRTPSPDEAGACLHFLEAQIDLVKPDVVIALGRCAADHLGLVPESGRWRGRWGSVRSIPALATYHPAYLLRSPEQKRPVWEDLKSAVLRLGRELPEPPRRSKRRR